MILLAKSSILGAKLHMGVMHILFKRPDGSYVRCELSGDGSLKKFGPYKNARQAGMDATGWEIKESDFDSALWFGLKRKSNGIRAF